MAPSEQPTRVRRVRGGPSRCPTPITTVSTAVNEIRRGRIVVVLDAPDRKNEGYLTLAADFVTPEAINFMARSGLISLCLTDERCEVLGLRRLGHEGPSQYRKNFTVSIDAWHGITTGISARDRARSIEIAADPARGRDDLVSPGHMFALRAFPGGLLDRPGHTEASIELARLAGLTPAAVVAEVMRADGTLARLPDLASYCSRHHIKLVTVEAIVEYLDREVCATSTRLDPFAPSHRTVGAPAWD